MSRKRVRLLAIGLAILVIIGGLALYFFTTYYKKSKTVSTYETCVNAGYAIQESYPPRCTTPDGKSYTQSISVTLDGTVVCLPHKDNEDVHTLECAVGFRADDGKYYGLQTESAVNDLVNSAGSDKKVRVSGNLTKNTTDRYKSEATLVVTHFEFL